MWPEEQKGQQTVKEESVLLAGRKAEARDKEKAHPGVPMSRSGCGCSPSLAHSQLLEAHSVLLISVIAETSKFKVLTKHLLNERICPHVALISRPHESVLDGMLIWRTIITIKLFLSETERPNWQAP